MGRVYLPGHQRLVPARKLGDLIARACRARDDRLVVEVAANVIGQRSGGRIAPLLVLLQCFGDDGLDVAAITAVDAAQFRRLRQTNRLNGFMEQIGEGVRHPVREKLVEDDPRA